MYSMMNMNIWTLQINFINDFINKLKSQTYIVKKKINFKKITMLNNKIYQEFTLSSLFEDDKVSIISPVYKLSLFEHDDIMV